MWRFFTNSGQEKTASDGLIFPATGLTIGGDVNLYRSAADVLRTDDNFGIGSSSGLGVGVGFYFGLSGALNVTRASLGIILRGAHTGDANPRSQIDSDGKIYWGPGGAVALDTNLYRPQADTLRTDDRFDAVGAVIANFGLSTQVILGVSPPVGLAGVTFGSAQDTSLYRSGANTLKTDSEFVINNNRADPTESSLYLNVNGVIKGVKVGVADSGGAGYKMLRVLN